MNIFKFLRAFFLTVRIKINSYFRKKYKKPFVKPQKTRLTRTKFDLPDQIKLVFTGSVGAGKTTAINIISEKTPISTETKTTGKLANVKNKTTVAMDYGSYLHKLKIKINLYGTPGQEKFGFMSSILTKGARGLIILINNNQDDPLSNLEYYLRTNEEFLQNNLALVAITHCDENNKFKLSDYGHIMQKLGKVWPIVSIDARKSTDIHNTLNSMIDVLLEQKTGEIN